MSKSSKRKMEEDKKQVLEQLINNSRQSAYDIAKKLGFSRQKVWRIIKILEEEKSIWGYTTIVDDESLNMNIYFALIRTKGSFFETINKLIERINKQQATETGIKVLGVFYVNGIYDGIVTFTSNDITKAKIFSNYVYKEYGNYIERIDLLENVFPLIKLGKVNPKIEEFNKFALNQS